MGSNLPETYWQILDLLKTKIRESSVKAIISANVQLLSVYWEIGDAIARQEKENG